MPNTTRCSSTALPPIPAPYPFPPRFSPTLPPPSPHQCRLQQCGTPHAGGSGAAACPGSRRAGRRLSQEEDKATTVMQPEKTAPVGEGDALHDYMRLPVGGWGPPLHDCMRPANAAPPPSPHHHMRDQLHDCMRAMGPAIHAVPHPHLQCSLVTPQHRRPPRSLLRQHRLPLSRLLLPPRSRHRHQRRNPSPPRPQAGSMEESMARCSRRSWLGSRSWLRSTRRRKLPG